MPPPPRSAAIVQDAATILSVLAQIAHKAAYAQAATASSSSAGGASSSSRPWPTQQQQRPRPVATPAHHPDKTSLPPQAPDGTFTEMKHVNAPRAAPRPAPPVAEPPSPPPAASTRDLDASLAAYFAEPVEDAKAAPEPPIPSRSEPSPPPISTTPAQPASAPPIEVAFTQDPPQPAAAATPPPPPQELEDDEFFPAYDATKATSSTPMRASRVPSSRLARLMHYGSLGAGLAWGAAGQYLSSPSAAASRQPSGSGEPSSGPPSASSSLGMSPSNVRRLVDKLSRMRGAALKLGQFLSIQDGADLLPKEIEEVLRQVQSSANYMPEYQLESVMRAELGPEWRSRFERFDVKPFAAASIGQVHYAVLSADDPEAPGMEVAVKVQFPGIRESIESDLGYLKWLLAASALLPRGLFLDKTIEQMRKELHDECDYKREAEMAARFGDLFAAQASINGAKPRYEVPRVIPSLCTPRVLTLEMMKGRPLSMVSDLSQSRRDALAEQLLHLCLAELFQHRLMQTDPNFSNFLYEPRGRSLQLIDFGATREYDQGFMDKWLRLLLAAVGGDEEECRRWSLEVGYLLRNAETGECLESDAMVAAHVRSMVLLGSPFRGPATSTPSSDTRYDFTTHSTLTEAIKAEIPLMLRERKTPPPKETYSLNRKLSGTFLLCSKLRAKVDCARVMREVVEGYRFEDGGVLKTREKMDGSAGWAWDIVRPQAAPSTGASSGGVRGFHTTARSERAKANGSDDLAIAEKDEARAASSTTPFVSVAERRRQAQSGPRKPERYGVNLGARYPRSLLPPSLPPEDRPPTDEDDVERMDTIAAKPAGTSFLDPTAAPSSLAEGGVRLGVPVSPAGRDSPRAEDPRTAIDEDTPPTPPAPAASAAAPPQPRIAGHLVPLKPAAPGPEDCCMSGCAVCVYDLYKDALTDWQENLDELRGELLRLPPSEVRWDEELLGCSREEAVKRVKGQGGVEESAEAVRKRKEEEDRQREDAILKGVEDPTMKAFLEMERAMKRREREKAAAAKAA